MAARKSKFRVLVMEQEEDLRHWLGRLLAQTEGFEAVGFLDKDAELGSEARRLAPHLILLDTHSASHLPPGALAELRKDLPGVYVVLMDLEEGPNYERLAQKAGADGFLSKARVPESLDRLHAQLSRREA
ncbi:MAG: response regulator [Thermodesulfobacteriota bacterium]